MYTLKYVKKVYTCLNFHNLLQFKPLLLYSPPDSRGMDGYQRWTTRPRD